MRNVLRYTVMALLGLVVLGANVFSQGFTFTIIDYPGSSSTTEAYGVNDSGTVVGSYFGPDGFQHGFIYSAGTYATLDYPNASGTTLIAINNSGQILGSFPNYDHTYTTYFIYGGGNFSIIGTNGVSPPPSNPTFNCANDSYPFQCLYFTLDRIYGLNDKGEIVGYGGTEASSDPGIHGLYGIPALGAPGSINPPTGYGRVKQVDCPSVQDTYATGLNNQDFLVGYCNSNAFTNSSGSVTLLSYPEAASTSAFGINNAGLIVGGYQPSGTLSSVGLLFAAAGTRLVVPPNATYSVARGINNNNQIVGTFQDNYGDTHGFITGPLDLFSGAAEASKTAGEICLLSFESTAASCPTPGQATGGDPITISTGNKFEDITDYATTGQNPLSFARYYNSLAPSPRFASMLGSNWSSTYDRYLRLSSPSVIVGERSDGKQLNFRLSGATWTPDTDVDFTLTNSGQTWTLTDHDDTVETYTANGAGTAALLQTIQKRNGYTQTLHYNASGQLASVTDSYNRTLTFTYANSLLQSVTTPDNTTITYGFTPAGGSNVLTSATYSTSPATTVTYLYTNAALPFALTGIIDENGNRYASWTYDASGRALTSQLGNGANLTTIAYNADGSRTVTNALGVTDTYKFTMLQGVPKVTEIDRAATATTAAATELFTYDANGYTASQTDWNGNQTNLVNDAHGDPTTINEAVGSPVARTTTIAYDPVWLHQPKQIVTVGLTTGFTYDAAGEMLTRTLTDTTTTTVPYATGGQTRTWTNTWANFLLESTKSPNGNLASFGYDASGALTETTNALGQTTRITAHSGGGLPQAIVDPNNVTTNLTYDARQRLLTSTVITAQGPLTTTKTYDAAGNLVKTTLPDNSALTNGYDTAHRLTKVTDLFHQNINYTLDALGDRTQTNLTAVGNRITRPHSDSFDALGRTLQDIGGMGQTTSYGYDANGNALTIKDPLTRVTNQVFDALNRLSTVTDPNDGVTSTTYDTHNRPVTVTDPNGNTTSFVYDGFGDVIQQTSPDSGVTVYHYDADANLTSKTDAAGKVTNNTYDALDRILTTTYPSDASENVAYTYDQSGHGFGIGRLTSLTDAAGALSRRYDERGNLLTDTRTNGATTIKTVYTYDTASRIASMTYPSGWTASYTRDIMGRIWQVPLTTPSGAAAGNAITNATYEPFGPLYTLTFGNGVNEARRFDLDYRVTSLTETGNAALQSLAYSYDANDNVSNIADAVTPANSQNFGYDVLNRLTSATGGYGSFAWVYDNNGNRLKQTLGATMTNYGYTPGTNRLASITSGGNTTPVGYIATGNISSIPPSTGNLVATLTYNAANRLNTVTGTALAITGTTYDAFGQRFSKTSGGSPTLFTYGQDIGLLEESEAGATTDYVYLDGRPIATSSASAGKVYFLHDDRLGTPQLATDNGQNVVWSAQYQPFGQTTSILGAANQNLRLPGQYFDAESGWNYNGWRDFFPNLGRYLESDPLGYRGGLDSYTYANLNSLKNVDVYGLSAASDYCSCLSRQLFGVAQPVSTSSDKDGTEFVGANASFVKGLGSTRGAGVFFTTSDSYGIPDIGLYSQSGSAVGYATGDISLSLSAGVILGKYTERFQGATKSVQGQLGEFGGSLIYSPNTTISRANLIGGELSLSTPGAGLIISQPTTSSYGVIEGGVDVLTAYERAVSYLTCRLTR